MSIFSTLTGWTWEQVIDAFATTFSKFFNTRLGKWLVSALAFIGIDLVSYNAMLQPMITHARNTWEGMGGDIMQWIVFLRLDQCLTIIMSAYTIAAFKKIFFGKKSA